MTAFGWCSVCGKRVPLRVDGTAQAHNAPYDEQPSVGVKWCDGEGAASSPQKNPTPEPPK